MRPGMAAGHRRPHRGARRSERSEWSARRRAQARPRSRRSAHTERATRAEGGVPQGNPAVPLGLDSDALQLFDRRETRRDLRDAVVPEGAHAGRQGRSLDLFSRRLRGGWEASSPSSRAAGRCRSGPCSRSGCSAAALLSVEGHPIDVLRRGRVRRRLRDRLLPDGVRRPLGRSAARDGRQHRGGDAVHRRKLQRELRLRRTVAADEETP